MARILLAEDDDLMRITIKDRLEKNKWHVDAVPNGREAVERLKKENFHLVISDIRMPGLDGWQLLKFVHQSSPNTDIIMMTAYGSVDDAIESLKKGAADYILKPFNMDDLIILLAKAGRNEHAFGLYTKKGMYLLRLKNKFLIIKF